MDHLLETTDVLITPEIKVPTAQDLIKAELRADYNRGTHPPSALSKLTVPPREPIVGEWFKQGDLGFIYGPRGLGKTWLALLLARKCVEGGQLAGWEVPKPRRVLYVDGEMPLDSIRERDRALAEVESDNMFYLQHEALFHATGRVLNLTDPSAQAAILEKCLDDKIEVLFLDNLSCLFNGIKENDADAWEQVLPWLLNLRRNKIAVVFIAHAGRNGLMRGTSRREDAAFWIINLVQAKDATRIENGARFVANFVKNRNTTEADCPSLEWHFAVHPDETRARVTWKIMSLYERFRQCLHDGLTNASEIAEELDVSAAMVSRMAKRAIEAGWVRKDGRDYVVVEDAVG